jgi:hypothetical protein
VELGQIETALPLLWDMMEGRDTATLHDQIDERPALHLPGEVTQRVTALLSFAPLDRLAKAAEMSKERPHLRSALCGALRLRHLSLGEFDHAIAFASDDDFTHWQDEIYAGETATKATRWREAANRLKQLTLEAKDADSWSLVALEWRRHLRLLDGGRVYMPQPYFLANLPPPSHELRALAAYLHVTDAQAAQMLDRRHALSQARTCFERSGHHAKLHEVLGLRAEASPYWMDRAVESGDSRLSPKLLEQLRRPEIVPWTFRPADTMGEWKPGSSALWHVEIEIATALGSVTEGFWEHTKALKRLQEEVKSLATGDKAIEEVRRELTLLREAVKREAPVLKASGSATGHRTRSFRPLRGSAPRKPACASR